MTGRDEGRMCECEHRSHFKDSGELSPNGNPGHKYGVHYQRGMVAVKTGFGTIIVCEDCNTDCWQDETAPVTIQERVQL